MEIMELHRGRLIDHVQLVVRDLAASRRFYDAVMKALDVPLGGEMEGFFWFDELCVSTANSPAAQGQLTGKVTVEIPKDLSKLAPHALDEHLEEAFLA